MTFSPAGSPSRDPDDFWSEYEAVGEGMIVRAYGSIDYATGLALLAHYDLLCQDRGNHFRVVAPNRSVPRVITLTGLDKMITVVPSVEEAILPG